MLKMLTINNVALIKNLELEFSDKLNILSGETGAGKSIIVDSLMLLLGDRYDKTILRYGEEKGFVEGVFDINEQAAQILEEYGFEKEDELIVNRKFNIDGKTEIRLNGRVASISMLKSLMSVLVDIYGQNEYQSLSRVSEHLKILSYFVRKDTYEIDKNLAAEYNRYQKINRELKEIGDASERERNFDMLKYQIDEILRAKTYQGEEEELLEKRRIISGAEKIAQSLGVVKENLLYADEISAQALISEALQSLAGISDYSKTYSELYERLNSLSIELDDIAETASDEIDNIEYNPEQLEKIEMRLDLLRSIKRKYGTYDKMQEFLAKSTELLDKLENSSEIYEKLLKEKETTKKKLYKYSYEVSEIRRSGALKFEKLIEKELADLGMNGSQFKVVFSDLPDYSDCDDKFTAIGFDKAEFYLSANAGQPIKPLIKIISGGEMSRFILALKVISSSIDDIPTMIFDEVDTGISGKIGQEVAKKLALISRAHQVLCVTHLAQIASMADNHYYIAKFNSEGETVTTVSKLSHSEIIEEISRLSGAKDISAQSNQNASEMKEWSDKFKKEIS